MAKELFLDLSVDLLQKGYRVRFQAKGRSMYPTIQEGEWITVEPVEASQVKWGDIILYQNHSGVFAHRVVKIKPGYSISGTFFILRGDASDTCDEPAGTAQILGKVISVERDGRLINLNSRRAKILYAAHLVALRLKRRVMRIPLARAIVVRIRNK